MQLTIDFDKATCKNCQHTGASVKLCFINYGEYEYGKDFLHITPDHYCGKFYSVDWPRFDSLTQPKAK